MYILSHPWYDGDMITRHRLFVAVRCRQSRLTRRGGWEFVSFRTFRLADRRDRTDVTAM